MRGVLGIALLKQYFRVICRTDIREINLSNRRWFTLAPAQSYCTVSKDCLSRIDGSLVDKYINFLTSGFRNQTPEFEKQLEDYNQTLQICEKLSDVVKKDEEKTQLMDMLQDYANDTEMKSLINMDLESLQSQVSILRDEILAELINPCAKMVTGDVVFEVSAGVGGQETMLFTQEIFEMYMNYFSYKGWSTSISSLDKTEIGGVRHATILVSGEDVFDQLKFEGGVHRVQRIPKTEKRGRLHTSTMTVVVVLQPNEIKVCLNPKDLKIETCRASGKGGQHVNTTDSAVRVVHIPTGITAECQTERSQIKNKQTALKLLGSRIFEVQEAKVQQAMKTSRLLQVGSANRNEKIRTYNFKDDRIKDHRLGKTCYKLGSFFEGTERLDEFIEDVKDEFKKEYLVEKMRSV